MHSNQNLLRLVDSDSPSALDVLRRIGTRVVGRVQHTAIARYLGMAAPIRVGDERQYVEVGEVKAQLEAPERQHSVGLEDQYERRRCRHDLGLNVATAVARHPVQMTDSIRREYVQEVVETLLV